MANKFLKSQETRWREFVREYRTGLQAVAVCLAAVPFILSPLVSMIWLTALPAWVAPGLWLWWETHHIGDSEDED